MRDYERSWYCLRDYNGYQYSNDGYLRSMKNYIKNPQGVLIKKYHTKRKGDYFYLVNNNNDTVKVYESEIKAMIARKEYTTIMKTNQTDISSRNKLVPTKRQKEKNNYVGIPKFTIIHEKKNALIFF